MRGDASDGLPGVAGVGEKTALRFTLHLIGSQKAAMEATYKRLLKDYGKDGKFQFYRPKGCPDCSDSGYKGRCGLHELMVGTDAAKKLIQEHARVAQLFAQALEDGMLTLKMDGMEKIMMGLTDLKQVRSVCIR